MSDKLDEAVNLLHTVSAHVEVLRDESKATREAVQRIAIESAAQGVRITHAEDRVVGVHGKLTAHLDDHFGWMWKAAGLATAATGALIGMLKLLWNGVAR